MARHVPSQVENEISEGFGHAFVRLLSINSLYIQLYSYSLLGRGFPDCVAVHFIIRSLRVDCRVYAAGETVAVALGTAGVWGCRMQRRRSCLLSAPRVGIVLRSDTQREDGAWPWAIGWA